MKVVLGLSGGMDSAALAAYYLDTNHKVFPVNFKYGSKHNRYEMEAAEKLVKHYKLPKLVTFELPFIQQYYRSNLLEGGGDIPEGHYEDKSMSLTVVPARNLIFISAMMGYAWSIGANMVGYGAHSGDHAIYDDCKPEFYHAMSLAVRTGSGGRISLDAPFLHQTKETIIRIGNTSRPSVPWALTRTCYKDQPLSCGKCGSCNERLEAFRLVGIPDPIEYEVEEVKTERRVPKY